MHKRAPPNPAPARSRSSLRTTPSDLLGSELPSAGYPPTCSSVVPPDRLDPTAHTLLPLSKSPTTPPPSPAHVPRRWPPDRPASLPTPADNVPTGSLGCSAPHRSVPFLRTPPPPLPAPCLPAPRLTRVCTSRSHTPPPCRSTHTKSVPVPPPVKHPKRIAALLGPSPTLPPTAPTPSPCIRKSASDLSRPPSVPPTRTLLPNHPHLIQTDSSSVLL